MIYTGIGSRETPENVLGKMRMLGFNLACNGHTLRSGGADGADLAFEFGAVWATDEEEQTDVEIYLPWKSFNSEKRFNLFVARLTEPTPAAYEMASVYHHRWPYLKYGAKALHARNCHQVLGVDLHTPSDFLVCWTEGGKEKGGTAQAMRIAKDYEIPIFNYGNMSDEEIRESIQAI